MAVERADAGNCELAIAEFEEIYRLLENPVVFFNMAVCYEQLHRYDDAVDAYERYLDEAALDASARGEVTRALQRLESFLGTVVVASNVPASVWIDDREAGSSPNEFRVPAGPHVVELRSAGYESSQREVVVASGRSAELAFELEKLNDFRGISSTWVWVSGAATVGCLLGAVAALSLGLSRRPDGVTVDEHVDRVGRPLLAADILGSAAGVLAIATVVLATTADWGEDDVEPVLSIGPAGASVGVRGSF